jgi:hypothetical protein
MQPDKIDKRQQRSHGQPQAALPAKQQRSNQRAHNTEDNRNPQDPSVGAGEALFHGWIDWRLNWRLWKVRLIVI